MKAKAIGSLTEEGVASELHQWGFDDVTGRQIAEWRRRELLPPFDVVGGGKGQGRGKERSRWADGESVVNQALWVRELLQMYRSAEDVRLPLWMLGFNIDFGRVREILGGPLDEVVCAIAEAVKNKSRESGKIEDLVEEATSDHVEELRRSGAAVLQIPQHALEAFFNVFVNQEYDLDDGGFEAGTESLKEYEDAMRERRVAAMAARGLNDAPTGQRDSSLSSFLDYAPFIKKYLSLYELKRAVDECTDEELYAVEHDLYLLREMALLAYKAMAIITRNIPAEYQPSRADVLRPIFGVGKVLILADLSLRCNGLAQVIDHFLPEALRQFREKFTEEVERELYEASQFVPEIVETSIPIIIDVFSQEVLTAGSDQSTTP